jgi:hypothetical protein
MSDQTHRGDAVNYIPAQGEPGSPVRHVQENPALYLTALHDLIETAEALYKNANFLRSKPKRLQECIDAARESVMVASGIRTGNQLRASVALLGEKGQ